jgi:glycosyltransferase involved in cell wall biosynthesis
LLKASAPIKNLPLVSVLIPVFNAGDYLRPSVESIISQTYANLEILIIDDGSTDKCMETIADINDSRIRIITQQNAGKSAALNHALRELSGTFYAVQDADDISHHQRIERQVECMQANPTIAAVLTGYDIILGGRNVAPIFNVKSINQCRNEIMQFKMPAHDPTAMFRVSLVEKFHYEISLRYGEGLDYIWQVGELYPVQVLGECLYSYRVHPCSLMTTEENIVQKKQMIRKVLERTCKRRGLDFDKCFPVFTEQISRFRHRETEADMVPHFMQSVIDLRGVNKSKEAFRTALICIKLHPSDPYYYKPLAYSIVPLSFIKYYRSIKAKREFAAKQPLS